MRYGIVKTSSADLRGRPDHKSEMVSQGLLGGVLRIRDSLDRGEWLKVSLPDGYVGWMRSWHVAAVTAGEAVAWRRDAGALVIAASADVRARRRADARRVRDLVLGCRLKALQTVGSWVRVVTPDGERGWAAKSDLLLGGKTLPAVGMEIAKTLRLFLGGPYLWGGVTPKGTDCSGMVQTAFGVHGVDLPRDVSEQRHCGAPVEGRLRAGDLLFFGPARGPLTHVGVWTGGRRFIHAGCPVEEASPDPRDAAYRPGLRARYRFARRVVA